jgi:hypothetical protein
MPQPLSDWLESIALRLRARQENLHPDPLDISYERAMSRPHWSRSERKAVRDTIRSHGPYRFARMERDMVWLRRECMKLGLDPEQARWLL